MYDVMFPKDLARLTRATSRLVNKLDERLNSISLSRCCKGNKELIEKYNLIEVI